MALEEPLTAEDRFFQALVEADSGLLDSVLAEDFLIVDVMEGGVTSRADFLAAVSAGQVTFHRVDPADRLVRRYGRTAVVVGRTDMSGASGLEEFTVASRYTHVFTHTDAGDWKLASAQGTQITR
jgi:ketosteroid isomerase-like protein